MVARIAQWTLDVQDIDAMARFWSQALGYRVEPGDDGCAKLYPPSQSAPAVPTIWLQATAGPKREKNRNHPDLRPEGNEFCVLRREPRGN